jgi:hypothetical protein
MTTIACQGQRRCMPTAEIFRVGQLFPRTPISVTELLTTIPIRQITIYGIRAINLISASLTPLFLLVALIDTQSLTGPAVSNATIAPTANEKLTNPTCAGLKLYGGSANS